MRAESFAGSMVKWSVNYREVLAFCCTASCLSCPIRQAIRSKDPMIACYHMGVSKDQGALIWAPTVGLLSSEPAKRTPKSIGTALSPCRVHVTDSIEG